MKTIFLADDDADDREFFEDALKDLGLDVALTTVNDGVDLMAILEAIKTEAPPPHIIFLDLNMPNKNGIECLEEIRKIPNLKNIPVAVFSTALCESTIDTTYSLGANCYVLKPVSHQLLKKTIEAVLGLELWRNNQQLPKSSFVLEIT